jgi:hypothetical protein
MGIVYLAEQDPPLVRGGASGGIIGMRARNSQSSLPNDEPCTAPDGPRDLGELRTAP